MTSTRARPFVAIAIVVLAACDSRGPAALEPATAGSREPPAATALATSAPTNNPSPTAPTPHAFETDAAPDERSPEYLADVNAVYLAAILHVFGPEVERLLVAERTGVLHDSRHVSWPDESRRIEALVPSVGAATLADFGARNATAGVLADVLDLPIPTTLISEDEVTAIFHPSGGGIEELRRRYPGAAGVTLLSGIGFDGGRMEALLYVESMHGYYVLLVRRGNAWKVVAAELALMP